MRMTIWIYQPLVKDLLSLSDELDLHQAVSQVRCIWKTLEIGSEELTHFHHANFLPLILHHHIQVISSKVDPFGQCRNSVSYTHLTLPTILLV